MDEGYNWDNLYFSMAVSATAEQQPRRLKGYYFCPITSGCGTDFIRAVATKTAVCPMCGNPDTIRIKHMGDAEFRLLVARWQDEGAYSCDRADLRKEIMT